MQGKIIKGIAGFYYVYAEDGFLYECKARGILRQKKITPLVGDDCVISIVDDKEKKGNLDEILPRKNSLIRPAVANVDQALIVFAKTDPEPNMGLLDRLLIAMEREEIPCSIVFNKDDLTLSDNEQFLSEKEGFKSAGYKVYDICVKTGQGMAEIRNLLSNKTTTLAGPSGVGKSSLINELCPDAAMEIGEISEKLSRGKHTTRHAQILVVDKDSFIFDTPGFTSFELRDMLPEDLGDYYPEFAKYIGGCKFSMCSHTHEPDCAIRNAVQDGTISKLRYDRYVKTYTELKNVRRY